MTPGNQPSAITPHAPIAIRPSPSAFLSRLLSEKRRCVAVYFFNAGMEIYLTLPNEDVFPTVKPFSPDGILLKRSVFNISPDCPYFYLFGGYVPNTPSDSPSLQQGFYCGKTHYQFTYGGTGVVEYTSYWGNKELLWEFFNPTGLPPGNNNILTDTIISPYVGQPSFVFQSPFAQNCTIFDQTYSDAGFACKWSCVADQVIVTSHLLNGPILGGNDDQEYSGFEFIHGVLQQPMANG